MNTPLFPVAIYPSQLDAFKTKAELLSTSISEALSIKKLSAFKRNDYLAIALGYKGHPDLVESSKFRVSSDKEQQLLIFSNEAIRQSIAEVFSNKLPNVTSTNVLLICEDLEKSELGSLVLTDTRKILEGSLVDKPELSNTDINPMLFFDEVGNSPEAIEQRQGAAKFFTEQDIKNTPKKPNINIVINLSEVPLSIGEEFYDHRQWLKFESEVKLRNRQHNIIFKFLEPKTKNGVKEDWQIQTSIDTWSEIEPTSNLLTVWNEFKDWLMSFFSTERIHVTERIGSHRWKTPVIQFHVSNPIEHQLSKLTKLEDITFFKLLSSNTLFFTGKGEELHYEPLGGDFDYKSLVINPHSTKSDIKNSVLGVKFATTDISDLGTASKEEAETILSNTRQFGKVFETKAPDVDLKDILDKNREVYINMDALNHVTYGKGKYPLSTLVESALKAQRKDVAQAKQILGLKLSENYGADIHDLCEHPITDTFGDLVEGQQEHRCLVCDKRWTEKVALWNEQSMKNHVQAIGQGTGKSRIEINLDESPQAPIIPDATLADMIQMVESCWPEGATCATQEADGEILFWSANVQDVLKARQIANTDDGLIPHIGFKYQVHANYYEIAEQAYVASNWKTSVVTPLDANF
jgi:hypothetical protein